jgi:hypothetical protein
MCDDVSCAKVSRFSCIRSHRDHSHPGNGSVRQCLRLCGWEVCFLPQLSRSRPLADHEEPASWLHRHSRKVRPILGALVDQVPPLENSPYGVEVRRRQHCPLFRQIPRIYTVIRTNFDGDLIWRQSLSRIRSSGSQWCQSRRSLVQSLIRGGNILEI